MIFPWTRPVVTALALVAVGWVPGQTDSDSVQARARGILERAERVTGSHKENLDQPFWLEGFITLLDTEEKEPPRGAYRLYNENEGLWREEVLFEKFNEVQLARTDSISIYRSMKVTPLRILQAKWGFDYPGYLEQAKEREVRKIERRTIEELEQTCLLFTDLVELCVDSTRGTLASYRDRQQEYRYGEYVSFGGRAYPRHIAVHEGKDAVAEVLLADLRLGIDRPLGTLDVPDDAVTWPWCPEMTPPEAIERQEIRWLGGQLRTRPRTGLTLVYIIERDGRVVNPRALSPAPKSLVQSVVESLRGWRYRPARCGDSPVPTEFYLQVDY